MGLAQAYLLINISFTKKLTEWEAALQSYPMARSQTRTNSSPIWSISKNAQSPRSEKHKSTASSSHPTTT